MGVTDRDIRAAVSAGAETVEEVMYCTGAGTRCGTCIPALHAAVADAEDAICASRRLPLLRPATSAA